MKRDMELVRRIVLAVQDLPPGHETHSLNGLDGIDKPTFAAHAQLLVEAGLVTAIIYGGDKRIPGGAVVFRLTWAGHEFADAVRSDTLWKKAKEHVIKPSASWTFGVLGEWLKAELKTGLGLP